ncbi:tetraspanin-2 [Hyalella azteca]|uniref:Tetraspanin-2 n=1 Tax=Hyalella azteca TaxID=294128 RepID=A0A979FJL4_HYAAZ|nr:tetraspanin-2 [Hyalella azteca]
MPGRSLDYRYSVLNNENAKFLTYVIIVFNIVFAILGSVMIALALYMLFETDFRRFIVDLGMEKEYWTGVYILLAAGILTMLQTFFGVLGAYQKKKTMLLIFAVSSFVCIVLEIAGATYMLKHGISYSSIEVFLYDRFMYFISVYDTDEQAKRTMSIIQEWPIKWYKKGYGYVGCVRGFTFYIEGMTGWISAVALILAFQQVFACIAAVILAMVKQEFKSSTRDLRR